ncbi:hypothetical protein B0H65DRAFT_505874 [Neurospora tetraspora]|uniref:Uncharacterized protein n=1 Tax=Neurospora tetraspora TaxID=94610 RepID=A0AAE0MXM0_9PEZI|nr:hypothetical protein B0H65DRAFT_505874 [Neurospora tetraspora]
MANSPSKVDREGAAFKTSNGQANHRVHEPHDTIGVEASSNLFSPQAGHILRELSKDFERLLLDDNWLFSQPRTPTSERTVLEHAIITKLYKIMIKKRAEKKILEAMLRKVLGQDKGEAHVDNTVSVTGIIKLVLDAIQDALDAKLEEDTILRWPAAATSYDATAIDGSAADAADAVNATDGADVTAGSGTGIDATKQGDGNSHPRYGPGR